MLFYIGLMRFQYVSHSIAVSISGHIQACCVPKISSNTRYAPYLSACCVCNTLIFKIYRPVLLTQSYHYDDMIFHFDLYSLCCLTYIWPPSIIWPSIFNLMPQPKFFVITVGWLIGDIMHFLQVEDTLYLRLIKGNVL